MATSGTSTYNATRASIIRKALIDAGMVGPDTVNIPPSFAAHAADLLDELLKSMTRRGAALWRISRQTLSVVSGTAGYSLPANTTDIDPPARFTQTGETDAQFVLPMPRKQYMYTSDRTTTGTPVQYYLERALSTTGDEVVTLYLYPTPSLSGTLEYAAVAKAQDTGTDANTLDIAQEWIRCVRFGLVADLSGAARATENERAAREQRFEAEFNLLNNADNETGDYQEVVMSNGYGPGWGCY